MLRITWRTWLVVGAILVVALAAVVWAVAVAPAQFAESLDAEAVDQLSETDRFESEDRRLQSQNAVRSTLVQAIGGMVLALGLAATWVTVLINRQGQITERFTRAVDQLGNSTSVDVRLGGIYALQRIARESEADRPAIVNVLAAFVRGHDPACETAKHIRHDWWGLPSESVERDSLAVLQRAPDVHEAAVALGELRQREEPLLLPAVYLKGVDLRGANLAGAQLNDANLNDANLRDGDLRDADVRRADLAGADLRGADLRGANVRRADLVGADLRGADLRGANVGRANLQAADLGDANLRGANLWGARLWSANLAGADLRRAHLGGADVPHATNLGAHLWRANLRGADLRGADLREADLREADLRGAILDGADLTSAKSDSDTNWPTRFEHRERGVIDATGEPPP